MRNAQPIDTAPRDPGVPINTDLGVVGWAQELWKAPPPFLQRGADYVPVRSREGGWRRMVETEVMGWAYLMPMDILRPMVWVPLGLKAEDVRLKEDGVER